MQALNCRSPKRRHAAQSSTPWIGCEMFVPLMLARVKERNRIARLTIDAFDLIAFEQVATAATQRQVRFVICPGASGWNDMLDLKREIENGFRSVAVLAAVAGSFSDPAVMGIHFSRPASAAAARSPDARTSACTRSFSSVCSAAESDCPLSRAERQSCISSSIRRCCWAVKN